MSLLPPSDSPAPDEPARLRAELAALRAALAQETADRQRLERDLAKAAETERLKLAQTLHDTVSQSLTALYLVATMLEKRLQASCPPEAPHAAELCGIIQSAAAELREVASRLRGAGQ